MSDTPDVPRREQDSSPSEADLTDSAQNTPTVEFRERAGKANPPQIELTPTADHSSSDPAVSPLPSPLAADVPPELADHPRYRVMEMLGKGGMGMVYKAEHRVMKRFVALKVIGAHLVAEPSALARFRREVEAAAKLSHPNIVTAYDAEQAGNCHFLVMELVDGISFDLVLKRKGPLPLAFACEYVRQAALGLQHAHEHRMVHRDIKLQNLMLTRKGQVKILDFGLARFASENGPASPLTECGTLTGTPDFMAPEQAEDARRADIRADIYSLGCTFYTLLTGELPFPGGSYVEKIVGHLKREPAPLTDFRSDLPPELVRIVERMMAKDPAQRFQTPGEAAKALLPFRKAGGAAAAPTPVAQKKEVDVSSHVTLEESAPASADLAGPTENILRSEAVSPAKPSRTRPARRRNRLPIRRSWKPVLIVSVSGAICVVCLGGLFVLAFFRGGTGDNKEKAGLPTPPPEVRAEEQEQGQVRIVSRDAHLRMTIRRGPKVFGTIGPDSNPSMMLPAGEYELEIVSGARELRGLTSRLSLARGDRKTVNVRREGIFVFDSADFPPPPPGPLCGPPPRPFGGPPRP